MASIEKRGKKYRVRISECDKNGVQKLVTIGNFNTITEAKRAALLAENEKMLGLSRTKASQPFHEYMLWWFRTYKENTVSMSTDRKYRYTISSLKEFFKDKTVGELTRSDYQEYINWRSEGLAKATIEQTHHQIRACVSNAVEDKLIQTNFTNRVVLKWTNAPKNEKFKYLSEMETKQFIQHCMTKTPTNRVAVMCVLLLKTGLRYGELLALSWNDINFDDKTLEVSKGYDYNYALDFTEGKNAQSKRVISLDSTVMHLLSLYKGVMKGNPYLFLNAQAKPFATYQANEKQRKKLFIESGLLNSVTFHGMRHTHASILLLHGLNVKYISRRLGHKDILITLNTYAHIIDEMEQKESAKLEEVMEGL